MSNRRLSTATKADQAVFNLFGGYTSEGVDFTCDQFEALKKFYGFDDEEAARLGKASAEHAAAEYNREQAKPRAAREYRHRDAPPPDVKKIAEDMRLLHKAGGERNIMRRISHDGLRVMALLSGYVVDGEDPVTLVTEALASLGYDIEVPDTED